MWKWIRYGWSVAGFGSIWTLGLIFGTWSVVAAKSETREPGKEEKQYIAQSNDMDPTIPAWWGKRSATST